MFLSGVIVFFYGNALALVAQNLIEKLDKLWYI